MTLASRNVAVLFGWALLCGCPSITLAQTTQTKPAPAPPPPPPPHYNPPPSSPAPQPRYNPPPSNPAPQPRYNPPPSNPAPQPRYDPPPSNQAPQRQNPPSSYNPNNRTPQPSTPRPSATSTPAPSTTYRPGASGSSTSGSAGAASKPPVTYTPGAPKPTSPSSGVTHTTGGATVYTPHAPSASTYTPSAPASPKPASTPTYRPAAAPQAQPVYKVPPAAGASHSANGSSALNPTASKSVVQQLNSTRAGMSGINRKPLPSGNVTVHANGNVTVATAKGARYGVRPNGTLASYSAAGRSLAFAPNGRVRSVHTASLDIRRGVHGERTVVTRRPDHSVLVSTGAHRGYLERTVVSGSRTYIARTYYAGGVGYTRLYSTYYYGGAMLPYYVPGVYYPPLFYGWAFNPWASPIAYSWGWAGSPWAGFYAGYFSPSPFYPGADAWLTDYFLSRTLASAYDDQAQPGDNADPGYPDGGQAQPGDAGAYPAPDAALAVPADTPITPELKALIADEVHRQIAYENAIATGTALPTVAELPAALKPDRVFVVSSNLDVTAGDDQTCSLSAGDVLQVATPPSDGGPLTVLRVAASRGADCPAGAEVSLSAQDLADMQNNLRAQMDAGLEAMRAGQGQRGLPSAPPSAMAQPPQRVALDVPLPPDPNVGAMLDAQQAEARHVEADVVLSASAGQQ